MFSRWLASTLVAAQLCAVAHLALVPHTASVDGVISATTDKLQEHLDAATHPGPHAHTPAPLRGLGEEHCTVIGLLRAATSAPSHEPPFTLSERAARVERVPNALHTPTRRELLLAAPKASPPVV